MAPTFMRLVSETMKIMKYTVGKSGGTFNNKFLSDVQRTLYPSDIMETGVGLLSPDYIYELRRD